MGIYIQEVQLSASSYTNTGVGGRSLDLNRPKQRLAMANNNKVLAAIVCICLVSGSQAFFLPMMMMGGNNDAMPGFLCMINPQMCPMAMFSGSDSARTIGFMNMMRQKGGASQMQKMAPLMAFSGSDSHSNNSNKLALVIMPDQHNKWFESLLQISKQNFKVPLCEVVRLFICFSKA